VKTLQQLAEDTLNSPGVGFCEKVEAFITFILSTSGVPRSTSEITVFDKNDEVWTKMLWPLAPGHIATSQDVVVPLIR
jgi:hypothetical protein